MESRIPETLHSSGDNQEDLNTAAAMLCLSTVIRLLWKQHQADYFAGSIHLTTDSSAELGII